jgi:hypothetical protein
MDTDKVQRYRDSLKYFEDLKKLREREDLDSLSDFFRSMAIRPTSEELEKPVEVIEEPKPVVSVEEIAKTNTEPLSSEKPDNLFNTFRNYLSSLLASNKQQQLDDTIASQVQPDPIPATPETVKNMVELEKPIAIDDNIESQLENTAGVGRELTEEELYQNLSQQQPEETTVEDFGGVTKAIEEAKQRTTEEPQVNLGTEIVTPTEQQIIDANTPRLGDEINLVKKRESVGDTNYLQEPKTETTEEPVFAEKPKSYYDTFDINLFRKGYNFHNPSDDDRKGKIWTGRYNEAMKIETPEILQNTVDRVLKAFPELNNKDKGNFYNEDFFIKLGKFESNAGQNLFNPKTRDYGMFQLNEDNLKKIFGDTKDFVNDTYKKGPKKGKKISAEEAKRRGKEANETFKNSFGVYYGKGIENITNITAEELKELFVKDRSEFLELIKNNHDVNLGIAISGSILPNLQK